VRAPAPPGQLPSPPVDAPASRFPISSSPYPTMHLSLTPIISILAGILVLVMPKLLNYIVGFYLIAIGVIGILGVHQIRI
jgi:hypothetical protein